MKLPPAVVVCALVLCAASPAAAQGTYADTITGGVANAKAYSFMLQQSGQFLATLSWDAPTATLAMAVVCGNTSPQTFGIGNGTLDRFARLEAGLIGGERCLISIVSFDADASYRLNIQFTAASPINRTSAVSLRAAVRDSGGPIDERLLESSERVLNFLSEARR